MLFKNKEYDLALGMLTEVENLVPSGQGIVKVHEYRAQCFFIRVGTNRLLTVYVYALIMISI